MVDPISTSRIGHRALYVGVVVAILLFRILPFGAIPSPWPGPDLVLCLTLVWLLRRPDYVPALLIVGVFLLEDVLTLRPPGLWPLIALIGTEFLRSREVVMRDMPFPLEWVTVALVMLAMMLLNRMVLALFMVPQIGAGQTFLQLGATILAYPLVAAVSHLALGLRRPATGEVDALGHRL